MILSTDPKPLAVTLDSATLARLDADALARQFQSAADLAYHRIVASVRDVFLTPSELRAIADEMERSDTQASPAPRSGFLFAVHRDTHAKLIKIATANDRAVEQHAACILSAV